MKYTVVFFVYLLTIFLFPQILYAQCSIAGKVTDLEGQSLSYISVQLFRVDSSFVTGTTTDTLGYYQFTKVSPSPYFIVFSSIGYKKQIVNANTTEKKNELPPVIMETDNIELNEVVVKGASVIRQKDRLLILPDKQQVKQAGTGYDLLYNLMIPGMEVDRIKGKVKTFGGEATLYIDGRKADYREVQSLRPRDIEKVEYFDTPSGRYADDVAAINYVTRQYKSGGYVAIDGRQAMGYLNGDYNIVSKLSHGNMNYTLFAGYSMNKYKGDINDNHEYFIFPKYAIDRKTNTLDNKVKSDNQYVQLNIANQNKKRNLLAKISFVRNDAPDNFSRELLEYGGGHTMNKESSKTTNQSGNMPTIDLYGYFNLKNNQYIESSLAGTYANNSYSYNYLEDKYTTLTHTKEDIYTVRADIKYGIRWKERNALSLRIGHYHTISSSHYDGNNSSWQHLWTGQTLFYAEYNRMFKKNLTFSVSPGLSSLQYRLHNEKRISQISPRLKTNLTYRISSLHQIVFNGVLGNTQPQISQLSNAVQEIDSLIIKRGNPNLDNTIFGDVNFNYSGQFKNLNLYAALHYERVEHVNTDEFFIKDGRLINTFRSDVSAHHHEGMLSATWKVSENFRLKMDGYWSITSLFKGISDKSSSLSGLIQMDYYWKNLSCSLYGKTSSKSFSADLIHRYEPAKYGLTARWSCGNWLVEAGAESPFTKHRQWKQSVTLDAYNYTNYVTGRIYQQTGFLKVIYTHNFGKKTARDDNNTNRHINSAILKAY